MVHSVADEPLESKGLENGSDKTEERARVVAQANCVHLRQQIEHGGGLRCPRRIERIRGRQLIDDWTVQNGAQIVGGTRQQILQRGQIAEIDIAKILRAELNGLSKDGGRRVRAGKRCPLQDQQPFGQLFQRLTQQNPGFEITIADHRLPYPPKNAAGCENGVRERNGEY
jgi:hypothetical protein